MYPSFRFLSHYPFGEREMKTTTTPARLLTAFIGMMLFLRGVQFLLRSPKIYIFLKFPAKVLQRTLGFKCQQFSPFKQSSITFCHKWRHCVVSCHFTAQELFRMPPSAESVWTIPAWLILLHFICSIHHNLTESWNLGWRSSKTI